MTAMFPDSGVPPADARNSLPDPLTQNCEELWYSTSRCQPRFDPAAANAMLAELINLVNRGSVIYDCTKLDQVQLAVRYLIQKSEPQFAVATGPQNLYNLALNPKANALNNGMTICMVPNSANTGACWVTLDGFGPYPLLRVDKQQLQAGDIAIDAPIIICLYNSAWYVVGSGLVKSMVPKGLIIMTGDLDAWIRTDGNDTTGDGTANSPDKAFRTIEGAWRRIGQLYYPSAFYVINLRLGIPGAYEGASLTNWSGRVNLFGNPNTSDWATTSLYTIDTKAPNPGSVFSHSLMVQDFDLVAKGVTFRNTLGDPYWLTALRITSGGRIWIIDVEFSQTVANGHSSMLEVAGGGICLHGGRVWFRGNSTTIHPIMVRDGARFGIGTGEVPSNFLATDLTFPNGYGFINVVVSSSANFTASTVTHANCVGMRYVVQGNSILSMNNQSLPGNQNGTADTGGVVYP
jgi:hypothetical protein